MGIIRLTKIFSFEMAHALYQYDGLCKNIHGHSYQFEVTIIGEPKHDEHSPKNGMLMDFTDLKALINEAVIREMDHALVLNAQVDPTLIQVLRANYEKIVLLPYQPTTENLLQDFAQRIQKLLPSPIRLYALKLKETATSFGEWYEADNF